MRGPGQRSTVIEMPTAEATGLKKAAYNLGEAAAVLGLSAGTVRNLLASGRLSYTTASNRVLISRTAIEQFLASPPERQVRGSRDYPTSK